MEKTKKIIISLGISLLVLLFIYFISNFKTNSEYNSLPVFKNNMLENSTVTKNDVEYIKVKTNSINKSFLNEVIEFKDNENVKVSRNVYAGEFVTLNVIKDNNKEQDVDYEYISLPISSDSLAICNKLKFGDKVDICYTAKLKDVSFAIKGKERIYSNNLQEGFVTCILFEDVDIVSKTDSTGNEDNNNLISNITIRLSKKDAMLIANLKSLGTIDVLSK